MKKGSVVAWIVAMLLMAIGVSFSATFSQASDLTTQMQAKGCDFHRMQQGDQVLNVRLSNIWGNTMWFDIDISVNAAHYYGSDGIARPGGRLKNVFVEVLAFDGNGNNLTKSFTSGHGRLVGTSTASASVTLTSAQALSQLVDLLVSVWEGTSGGFRFCQVWKYANVYTGAASAQPKVYTVPAYTPPKAKVNKVPTFPPPYSQSLNTVKANYGPHRWPNDKVIGVRLSSVSGNVMSFEVDVSVDQAHIFNLNKDGVYRTSPLTGVHVAVLPYDNYGKCLWSTVQSARLAYPKPKGSKRVSTKATLAAGAHFTQVADLLVAVWESETGPNKGTRVSFCDVVKWTDVQHPKMRTVEMVSPDPNMKKREIILKVPTYGGGQYAYWMGRRQIKSIKDNINGSVVRIENKNRAKCTVTVFHDKPSFYSTYGYNGIQLKPGVNEIKKYKADNLLNDWRLGVEIGDACRLSVTDPVTLVIHYVED